MMTLDADRARDSKRGSTVGNYARGSTWLRLDFAYLPQAVQWGRQPKQQRNECQWSNTEANRARSCGHRVESGCEGCRRYDRYHHYSSGTLRVDAGSCKGMLLRTGTGEVKHFNTRWLWVQRAMQRYGVEVQMVFSRQRFLRCFRASCRRAGEIIEGGPPADGIPHSMGVRRQVVGSARVTSKQLHLVGHGWRRGLTFWRCRSRRERRQATGSSPTANFSSTASLAASLGRRFGGAVPRAEGGWGGGAKRPFGA